MPVVALPLVAVLAFRGNEIRNFGPGRPLGKIMESRVFLHQISTTTVLYWYCNQERQDREREIDALIFYFRRKHSQ